MPGLNLPGFMRTVPSNPLVINTAGGKENHMITVNLEPDGEVVELYKTRTVIAALNKLKLRSTMAIVVRDGELLTADRRLKPGDTIMVRKVTSAG